MRLIHILTTLIFINLFSLNLSAKDILSFTPKGDVLGTQYRYGLLNVDDGGVKSIAVALAHNKTYYAFFSDTVSSKVSDYTLIALSSAPGIIALGFVQNDNAYNNHIVLLSTADKLKIIDQVGGGMIDNFSYNFTSDLSPITIQKKLKSSTKDKSYDVEVDFSERQFRLFLELSKAGISVNLDPKIYQAMLDNIDTSLPMDEYQFREYLLYNLIVSKFSYKQAVNKLDDKNSEEKDLRPLIIEQAVDIKKYADELKIGGDLLVAYFSGQTGLDDLRKILSTDNQKKADNFIELITLFEVELSRIGIDEVIFNDFAEYFLGKINKKELKQYVDKSLSSIGGDIKSILSNYKEINSAIHNAKTRFYLKEFYGK